MFEFAFALDKYNMVIKKNLQHNKILLNLIHKQFALRIFAGFTIELVSIM